MISIVVVCPLSVTDGWVSEIVRFAPCLNVLQYVGDKDTRRNARRRIFEHATSRSVSHVSLMVFYALSSWRKGYLNSTWYTFYVLSNWRYWQVVFPFDVLLTTYDIALMDQDFLSQIPWQYAVIDEAQRLKNPSSVRKGIICSSFLLLNKYLPQFGRGF